MPRTQRSGSSENLPAQPLWVGMVMPSTTETEQTPCQTPFRRARPQNGLKAFCIPIHRPYFRELMGAANVTTAVPCWSS